MCTPFDEKSVDLIEELDVEICKIGRCRGREACSIQPPCTTYTHGTLHSTDFCDRWCAQLLCDGLAIARTRCRAKPHDAATGARNIQHTTRTHGCRWAAPGCKPSIPLTSFPTIADLAYVDPTYAGPHARIRRGNRWSSRLAGCTSRKSTVSSRSSGALSGNRSRE